MKILILTLAVLMIASCGGILPTPQMGRVVIDSEIPAEVTIDLIPLGITPVDALIIENYPNYVQVGTLKFVLIPPCTYARIYIEADVNARLFDEDEIVSEVDTNFF